MLRLPTSSASDLENQQPQPWRRRRLTGPALPDTPTTEGDIDDAATARLHHAAQHRFGQAVHRLEVGVRDGVQTSSFMHQQLVAVMPALLIEP